MEISEYDEYLPERELDKNFKIPRKRTAEDSFGSQAGEAYAEYYAQAAQAAQLQYNQAQAAAAYAQYATLSGAASQATAYTNSKPPVPYSVTKQAKLDTSIQPPLPPGYATGTVPTNSSYSNQTIKHEIAAPNSNPYAPLITSTTSSQNVPKVTPNKNWITNTNRNWSGNNMTDSKQMGAGANRNWAASGSGNGGNRNWGPGQNRGWVGGDTNNSQGGNVSGTNRGWGGNQNRNWGIGNLDSGNLNSANSGGPSRNFNMKSERNWEDSYEGDNINVGNSDRRSWGERENLGRNWGEVGVNSFNRNIDDFEPTGLGRWNTREARETFGGGGGDYSSNQFGGRGRSLGPPMGRNMGMEPPIGRGRGWLGRGSSNNLGGRNLGVEDGFNDADGFEENRGFGMLKSSWNQKDFGSEPFDNSQQDCVGFAGRGRGGGRGAGGPDRWIRGRGGSRGGKPSGASGFGQWQRPKERPKNNSYGGPVNIPDVSDASLPEELRMMFQPLYCKLCQLQMSSNIMAKMHYKSKNHEKKIRKFLSEYSVKTGEPLHPRAKAPVLTEKKEPTEEEKDPKYFHCEVCDLPLTGKLHAESHYMGRNHNAVVMGKKQPSGKGHYDENGKWIRDKTEKVILSEGDDSFGLAFRKKDVVEGEEVDGEKKSFKAGEFSCSLCCVTCTCQEQITAHFNGSKHKKKLKQLGISPENFEPLKDDESVALAANEGESASPQDAEDGSIERNNFSRYKTPSGYFYCEKCNLVLNSEVQLKQHLESKNHLKKATKKPESKADPKSEPIISTEITT